VIEEQEAANEDLKSANEEILSSNEELQSTNEELETAKEELQSVNEELTTVNEQLQYSNVELSRLNDDFTNLLGSARVPMVALDVDQRIRRFTPAAAKLLNLLPVDIGRPIGSLKPHLDEPGLEALVAEVIATAQVEEREVRDRHGCWFALRVYPYRTADDRIDGAVVVLVGIDEVKGAQERLQKARDFAQAIVGTIREPLLVLDAELRVQSANPAFHETFAVGPGEAEGRLLGELGGGQWDIPALGKLLREVLTLDTALVDFEVTRDFAGLGPRALLLNARAIQSAERASGEPELILLAIRDVSHRKRLENELLESSRQLTEAGRRKDEFLATLAHELRNPLAPILNSLELIEQLDSRERAAGKARGIVKRQVSHMVRLIDDLLDISRVTSGRIRLCRERVDLAAAVDQAVEAIRPALEAAGHTLVVDPAAEPLVLDADPVRLVQIVENLLSNAVKYTVQGAGGIELRTARQDGQAVLRVRDAGIGIAPEMLAHVWELFMQVDPTYERSQSGLGIGLALVRSLAELHGGSVEVTSAGLGEGSEFTVRLPLADVSGVASVAPVAPAADTADLADPAESTSAGAGVPGDPELVGLSFPATPRAHRILVLDDNLDQAGSLSLLLTLWGHDVRTTHDGPAALAEAAAFRPEVVILDIGLPGMDGHEVARRLRRDPAFRETVLIALSGYGTDEDRRQSQEAGIDTHLVKPVEPGALRALLSELGPRG
jgi:two-component system, chemotaxis family, CheB/CheR fusion protein